MMNQVEKLEGKELLNTIVFAKCLLNSLLISELVKNPKYTLLALHDLLVQANSKEAFVTISHLL